MKVAGLSSFLFPEGLAEQIEMLLGPFEEEELEREERRGVGR